MAQWIPKTAWKVSNLNKRYGPQYALQPSGLNTVFEEAQLQGYTSVMCNLPEDELKNKIMFALQSAPELTASKLFTPFTRSANRWKENKCNSANSPPTSITSTSEPEHHVKINTGNTNDVDSKTNLENNSNIKTGTTSSKITYSMLIDVRDDAERRRCNLDHNRIYALHPHDLLSGTALPILPVHKMESEMFVIVTSSASGRAVQTCTALRRWGYHNLHVVEANLLSSWLAELPNA